MSHRFRRAAREQQQRALPCYVWTMKQKQDHSPVGAETAGKRGGREFPTTKQREFPTNSNKQREGGEFPTKERLANSGKEWERGRQGQSSLSPKAPLSPKCCCQPKAARTERERGVFTCAGMTDPAWTYWQREGQTQDPTCTYWRREQAP